MGLAVAPERQPQRLLGSGLADRAGDADDLCRRTRARRPREVAQSVEHLGHDQQRRIRGKAGALVRGHHRKGGTGRERGRDEIVAVAVVALDGEKRFSGRNRAGVDRDAGNGRRQRAHPCGAHRFGHCVDGPKW